MIIIIIYCNANDCCLYNIILFLLLRIWTMFSLRQSHLYRNRLSRKMMTDRLLSTTAETAKLQETVVSFNVTESVHKNNNSLTHAAIENQQKCMTILQRFEYFPKAFQNVLHDVRVYFLIQDALRSPRNQWTTPAGPPVWVQWKQQRLRKELVWIVPLAAACMLPVIGYIPSLLAFVFPQQLLTRHFWNEYEQEYFASTALERRHLSCKLVREYWWKYYPQDMERLFHSHHENKKEEVVLSRAHHAPEYWKQLAQAAGCFSFFPNSYRTWKLCLPYWQLQARMHLNQLEADDTLLLNATSFQDTEVEDACRIRGIPADHQSLQLYLSRLRALRVRTAESDWGLVSLLAPGLCTRS